MDSSIVILQGVSLFIKFTVPLFAKKYSLKTFEPSDSRTTPTAATLGHLCAPLMHIAQCLNLIIIMLNQGSSCENSLSYLVAPRPQNIYIIVSIFVNMHVLNLWPNK